MCFGCSKEPSHWDGSFEYPQHMFWMRNEENRFLTRTLIWGPASNQTIVHGLAYLIATSLGRLELDYSTILGANKMSMPWVASTKAVHVNSLIFFQNLIESVSEREDRRNYGSQKPSFQKLKEFRWKRMILHKTTIGSIQQQIIQARQLVSQSV